MVLLEKIRRTRKCDLFGGNVSLGMGSRPRSLSRPTDQGIVLHYCSEIPATCCRVTMAPEERREEGNLCDKWHSPLHTFLFHKCSFLPHSLQRHRGRPVNSRLPLWSWSHCWLLNQDLCFIPVLWAPSLHKNKMKEKKNAKKSQLLEAAYTFAFNPFLQWSVSLSISIPYSLVSKLSESTHFLQKELALLSQDLEPLWLG